MRLDCINHGFADRSHLAIFPETIESVQYATPEQDWDFSIYLEFFLQNGVSDPLTAVAKGETIVIRWLNALRSGRCGLISRR